MVKKVALIMGHDSDLPGLEGCIKILRKFGVPFEAHIISAHRTPAKALEFAAAAEERGFGVIIAAAGKAAHLAGFFAAHTILPVIGVPVKSTALDGLDALLSTVQMPRGVPVATVAIDGGDNAAVLAVQILALADGGLTDALRRYKADMTAEIEKKDAQLQDKILEIR